MLARLLWAAPLRGARAAASPQRLAPAGVRAGAAAGAAAGGGSGGRVRSLSVHEHLSMELLASYGVTVPRGAVATTPAGAAAVARAILSGAAPGGGAGAAAGAGVAADVVIKAQALTGGRGLGTFTSGFRGGVHMVTSASQAEAIARKMLGQRLITKQARWRAPRRRRRRARSTGARGLREERARAAHSRRHLAFAFAPSPFPPARAAS